MALERFSVIHAVERTPAFEQGVGNVNGTNRMEVLTGPRPLVYDDPVFNFHRLVPEVK